METKRFQPWPLAIAGLMALFVMITLWSVFMAASGVSAITDQGYYSHGLKYDHTQIEQKAAASRGWVLRTRIASGTLEVHLVGADGAPVVSAQGQATIFISSSGGTAEVLMPLEEAAPGLYTAQIPPDLRGESRIGLSIHRDGARIEKNLLIRL